MPTSDTGTIRKISPLSFAHIGKLKSPVRPDLPGKEDFCMERKMKTTTRMRNILVVMDLVASMLII
jgi:hypothetical protein